MNDDLRNAARRGALILIQSGLLCAAFAIAIIFGASCVPAWVELPVLIGGIIFGLWEGLNWHD